jgi:alkaline phosphatase
LRPLFGGGDCTGELVAVSATDGVSSSAMNAVRPSLRTVWVLAALLVAMVLSIGSGRAATASHSAAGAPALDPVLPVGPRVVAVGDIASATGADDRVADLVAEFDPDALLLLGDIAYPDGSAQDFASYFAPDWARFSDIWLPVPGNHEYRTPRAGGYRQFFGVPSGPLYSTGTVGGWRVIGLDSERATSLKQLTWLRATLKANPGQPTIVIWHRARYSSGQHGDSPDTDALWDLVKQDPDVRLVLWGHDHNYERMAVPVNGRAALPAMVVGTGGGKLRPTPQLPERSWREVYVDNTTGVLDLRLGATSFTWRFVTTEGTSLDQGEQQWPQPRASVRVRTVKEGSRLHVNVNPNVGADYWWLTVGRKGADGSWARVGSYRTRKAAEVRTLDLPRGTYRVRVKAKFGHLGVTSPEVRLLR